MQKLRIEHAERAESTNECIYSQAHLIKSCHSNRTQQIRPKWISLFANRCGFLWLYHLRDTHIFVDELSMSWRELDFVSVMKPPFSVDFATQHQNAKHSASSMLWYSSITMPGPVCSKHTHNSSVSCFFLYISETISRSFALSLTCSLTQALTSIFA